MFIKKPYNHDMKNILTKFLLVLLSLVLLSGCSSNGMDISGKSINTDDYPASKSYTKEEVLHNSYDEDAKDAKVAYLSLSTKNDGYIGARLSGSSDKKIKMRIVKDDKTYTYDITSEEWVAYPLQMGDGEYLIKVLENIEGKEYAVVYSKTIKVSMTDELNTYLYPNQIVNYDKSDKIMDISFDLTKDDTNNLQRIINLFQYVLKTLSYDNDKAQSVSDIYTLPDMEGAIDKKKGICFDYASLLVSLCRIQHIPARVIVGYTDIEYHAWCEIYLENEGWINPKIFLAGLDWSLVDPTFADSKGDYEGNYDEVYRY